MKIIQSILKHKIAIIILLVTVMVIPTFYKMVRFGIYSMQDFHIFRLYEYNRCFADLQIPCRWSPDVSFGYGQPLFNFYGQLPYLYGEIFHWVGFSLIDSLKITFASSLLLSAIAMFFLSKQLWKNNMAALISSIIYTYAPYRAVDVWVRGALPEAFAFIFFPLIVYFYNLFLQTRRKKYLFLFGLSFAGLILTHNLSAFMFLFFLLPWGIYYFIKKRGYRLFYYFLFMAFLVFGMCAFYILPIVGESLFTTLPLTTQGYFSYYNHFITLFQIFFSRFWGYGGSTWGDNDGLSLSLGQIQWIIPLITLLFFIAKRKSFMNKNWKDFFALIILGFFMLFLTHNKSSFLWSHFTPMHFFQFPWRFLGLGVFCFSLSAGFSLTFFENRKFQFIAGFVIIFLTILFNVGFFHEDLWYPYSDAVQFSGANFDALISSSVTDYWPDFGRDIPNKKAPFNPLIATGSAVAKTIQKNSDQAQFQVRVSSSRAFVNFPIVYFPGWQGRMDGKPLEIFPDVLLGRITAVIPQGSHLITIEFKDTQIRTIGNLISLVSIISFALGLFLVLKYDKKKK